MICLIALLVFGILSIFSATHRKIAKEAFDCVFNRVRLRPCVSGLDQRIKGHIVGKLMNKSARLARFTYRNFEAISWAFTIITVVSLAYSLFGLYSYMVYGNCNGENSQGACIYSSVGSFKLDVGCGSPLCQNKDCTCKNETFCQETDGEVCTENCTK